MNCVCVWVCVCTWLCVNVGVKMNLLLYMILCAHTHGEYGYHFSNTVYVSVVDRVSHWPGTLQVNLAQPFPCSRMTNGIHQTYTLLKMDSSDPTHLTEFVRYFTD